MRFQCLIYRDISKENKVEMKTTKLRIKPAFVVEGKLTYIISTRTYVIPDKEMSDEEILEIIDYGYKSDHSLREDFYSLIWKSVYSYQSLN